MDAQDVGRLQRRDGFSQRANEDVRFFVAGTAGSSVLSEADRSCYLRRSRGRLTAAVCFA
jgi:hypothetical protein